MESQGPAEALLELGESLPKRPRYDVVFESEAMAEEDLGEGETALILDRIDQLMERQLEEREEVEGLRHLVQTQAVQLHKQRLMLEALMRRVVALERPE